MRADRCAGHDGRCWWPVEECFMIEDANPLRRPARGAAAHARPRHAGAPEAAPAPAAASPPSATTAAVPASSTAAALPGEPGVVVFDIDGTLADVSERLHHVQARPKNWDAFFAGMAQDKAIRAIVRLCNLLHDAGLRVVLCSGRPETYRETTLAWLHREGVRFHELRLRRSRDRRSDTVAKREMMADLPPAEVLFIVEDRSAVVEMWRTAGYVCLQCAPGEF
jgi:putative acid phosphatase of HAD superfamily subfamily IIIB